MNLRATSLLHKRNLILDRWVIMNKYIKIVTTHINTDYHKPLHAPFCDLQAIWKQITQNKTKMHIKIFRFGKRIRRINLIQAKTINKNEKKKKKVFKTNKQIKIKMGIFSNFN